MRRVITLSFSVQAKTRSTNRTRASRHSNSRAILGRSFVPPALNVAVSHTIIGPRETGRQLGEGAKNSDRAAARFGLNRPIKSRQSHCRRESSEDRLLFFTRRTRLPGRSAVRPSQRGYSDSRARFGPVDHLGPKNWSHNQKSHSVLSWLLRTRRRPTAVPATSRGDWNVSGKRTKAGHAPQWPS